MECYTVLLVDNKEEIRSTLVREFEAFGYKVVQAEDVNRALDRIHSKDSEAIDSVILDMRMGDETAGLKVLRAALHYGIARPSVPIIVFTAYESYDNCVAAIKAGAADYIPKGVVGTNTVRELVRRCTKRIHEARAGHPWADDPWLDRNFERLVAEYGGQRIAVFREDFKGDPLLPDAKLIDGRTVLIRSTYEDLRDAILRCPRARDDLPLMALLPEKGST